MNGLRDQQIRESIDASAHHYGADSEAMRSYLLEGYGRALSMPNRGPIRFDEDGALAAEIAHAYAQHGFYVFEGVLAQDELEDIDAELQELFERFPTHPGSAVDAQGRPALAADCQAQTLLWSKPLGDPLGGTRAANGRHQIKLFEPKAADDAPDRIVYLLLGSLQFSDTALRVYGHPELLRVAAAVNGEDFAPFNEALFIKAPGRGAAVSWHQDGTTHWDHPDWDEGTHGFNFMAQVYGSDPVNGVWVVPGTHRLGRVDIPQLVAESGSERLSDAVPLVCNPGDVVICNRQLVHGSFANSGTLPRVTVNFGFHRRASVLDVQGAGIHSKPVVYDASMIAERSKVIGYAIDARRQRFPEERAYSYQPLANRQDELVWDDEARSNLKDYNLLDLSI